MLVQAQLSTMPDSAKQPFVLPFRTPTFNGAHPARKVVQRNHGKVPHIDLTDLGLDALHRATAHGSCRTVVTVAPRPYSELMAEVSSQSIQVEDGSPVLHVRGLPSDWSALHSCCPLPLLPPADQ